MSGERYALLLSAIQQHINSERAARCGIGLLKVLANSDDVKRMYVGEGEVGLGCVMEGLTQHQSSPGVCEKAVGCLASMSLRQPDIAVRIVDRGGIQLVMQVRVCDRDYAHNNGCAVYEEACRCYWCSESLLPGDSKYRCT